MNEELEGCQYGRCCNSDKYFKLQQENQKLKQWDANKDTRNSRQRVENAKLIKENTQLKQDVEKLAHNMTVQDIYNAKIVQQLKDKDEKISKVIELLKNPSTIEYKMYGLECSRDIVNIELLLNILESNKED